MVTREPGRHDTRVRAQGRGWGARLPSRRFPLDERRSSFRTVPRPVDTITKAEWIVLRERLVKFAFSRTRLHERADDLAQEAMRRVLDDHWEPWNPATHPDILRYMMSIVNREIANKRSMAATHREIAMASEEKSTRAERRA